MVDYAPLNLQPLYSPKGWLHLKFAFDAFCFGIVGNDWPELSGDDLALAHTNPPLPRVEVSAGLALEISGGAFARFFLAPLCNAFNGACRSRSIQTAYSTKGGGPLTMMDPAFWLTDDPRSRYQYYSFDPNCPFGGGSDLPCWIYVRDIDFFLFMNRVMDWRRNLPCGRVIDASTLKKIPFEGSNFLLDFPVRIYPGSSAGTLTVAQPRFDFTDDPVATPWPYCTQSLRVENQEGTSTTPGGRPSKKPGVLQIFAARIEQGKILQNRIEEARAIVAAWAAENPPRADTVSGYLSEYYKKAAWENRKLLNSVDLLKIVRSELKTDKPI